MERIHQTVKKETGYILLWSVILSVLLEAVFLVIGKWEIRVLWGNLLSGTASVLNFFFMALTVQKAVTKEEKSAKSFMGMSQTVRMFCLTMILAVGIILPYFHLVSLLVPLFFPRIAIALRPFFDKKIQNSEGSGKGGDENDTE